MKLISVCIPTYEMNGYGDQFLRHSLEILELQGFKDYEVVISDHSQTSIVKDVCDAYNNRIDIAYLKNKAFRGS